MKIIVPDYYKEFKYDEYYIFQLKYPKTIFSYNTALYFYEMTERTPIKMDVSISKNYNIDEKNDDISIINGRYYFTEGNGYIESSNNPLGGLLNILPFILIGVGVVVVGVVVFLLIRRRRNSWDELG